MNSRSRGGYPPASAIQVSNLRKMRDVEQVAAVCYRFHDGEIEFLLIQTRGSGRWTFPKGGAEAGLTHAQAAAIEAFEEAGVHGRIEERAFARYSCQKNGRRKPGGRMVVSAHLCEVLRLSAPKESGRNRTWFSAHAAQVRLRDRRKSDEGREFAGVVEKAVERIRSFPQERVFVPGRRVSFSNDEWNRVQIEMCSSNRGWAVDSQPQIQRLATIQRIEFTDDPNTEAIPFGSAPTGRDSKLLAAAKKFKALGTGTRVQ